MGTVFEGKRTDSFWVVSLSARSGLELETGRFLEWGEPPNKLRLHLGEPWLPRFLAPIGFDSSQVAT